MQNDDSEVEKRKAKWNKFNATHEDSWETVMLDGV